MTTAETHNDDHVKELALRRFWTGELGTAERPAVEAHTTACARCRARLKELGDEQRRFEQSISFDRFAAGVERAARQPRRAHTPASQTARWAFPALGLAAALVLTITVAPRLRPGSASDDGTPVVGTNGIKGGAGITVQVGGAAGQPQRRADVDAPETLSPGEHVRIGYWPSARRFVAAISIDDQGEVTALYPEAGRSLPVGKGAGNVTRYLPDSIEFTGQGSEQLIVVLSDEALDIDAIEQAARAAYQKSDGDLGRLPSLDLPGEQFRRTFVKP